MPTFGMASLSSDLLHSYLQYPTKIDHIILNDSEGQKIMRWLFLGRFWPLLNQALFLEAAGKVMKIRSSLKPNHHGNLSCPNPWNTLYVVQLSMDYFTTLSHFYLLLLLRWQPWCRSWCTACISSTRAVGWERSWRSRSCRSRPSPCPRSCRRDSSRPSLSNRLTRKRSSRCFKTLQDWITDYRISHLQLPGVNFINILRSPFSYKIALRSFFSSYSLALYFGKGERFLKKGTKFFFNKRKKRKCLNK